MLGRIDLLVVLQTFLTGGVKCVLFYLNCLCVGVEACYIEDGFLIS